MLPKIFLCHIEGYIGLVSHCSTIMGHIMLFFVPLDATGHVSETTAGDATINEGLRVFQSPIQPLILVSQSGPEAERYVAAVFHMFYSLERV